MASAMRSHFRLETPFQPALLSQVETDITIQKHLSPSELVQADLVVARRSSAAEFRLEVLARYPVAVRPPSTTMIRRQARERREWLYKKAGETQEAATFERKQAMKDALASGKQMRTELRRDAATMGKDLKYDEAQSSQSFPFSS